MGAVFSNSSLDFSVHLSVRYLDLLLHKCVSLLLELGMNLSTNSFSLLHPLDLLLVLALHNSNLVGNPFFGILLLSNSLFSFDQLLLQTLLLCQAVEPERPAFAFGL